MRGKKRQTEIVAKTGRLRHAPGIGGDRFHLEKMLGAGGMCEVYAAQDLRRMEWGDADPHVAIKRLLPKLQGNTQAQIALAQEFFILRHLVHPGIVRVFDIHPQSWGLCYSMELLEGAPLHHCTPAMQLTHAFSVGAQLFDILHFLHTHGITHGDIKPANLFLAAGGHLTIIDFNIAVVKTKPGTATSPVGRGLREALHLSGRSLLHAAPECLRGEEASPASDIFSACCSVYELIAGKHPFNRKSSLEAQEEALNVSRPEGISGSRWKMLCAGLAFDAALRPSAEELVRVFSTRGAFYAFTDFFTDAAKGTI